MLEIMKCHRCGKLAMIIREGGQRTICCDQLMEKLVEKGQSLHAPVIKGGGSMIDVVIPGVTNPMGSNHYIEWIEVIDGPYLHVKGLKPGDAPQAEFAVTNPQVKVRAYCEEHGLCSNHPSKH